MFKRLVIRYLPFSLVLLLAISLPMSQVLADCTWAKTFDFTSSEQGWSSIVSYPYTANWLDQTLDGDGQNRISYSYTFAAPTKVTTFTAKIITYDSPISSGGTVTTSTSFGLTGADDPIDTHPPYDDSIMYAVTTSGSASSDITFDIHGGSWGFSIFQIVLDGEGANEWGLGDGCSEGGGFSGLTKPIKSTDLHVQWGMFDYQYVQDNDTSIPEGETISDLPNTVYAFSTSSEAKVSAVADGTVTDVKPYTGADCNGAFVVFQSLRRCSVFVPEYIAQEGGSLVFNVELVNLSTVTVQDASDSNITYTYWLADVAVSVGQEVVAGCVLGKTIQLKNPTNNEFTGFDFGVTGSLSESGDAGLSVNAGISAEFRSLLVDAGVTTVVAKDSGEPVQLYPFLTEEPDYANCRAANASNCTLENPTLQATRNGFNPDGWGIGQGTILPGGGVHLLRGGMLRQDDVVIRPDIGYTLSVMARVTTPIDSFYPIVLQVGSVTTTRNITEGDYQLVTWALTAREVSLTSVSVINSLDTQTSAVDPPEVDILKVCLSPDTATVAPGACYFPDHSFDANGQGWVTTGNVSFKAAQAFMGDSSILSYENAILLTDGGSPQDYHLKALVRLNANSSYTGQIDKSVELKYAYPYESGFVSLGVIDSALVDSEGRNTYDGNVNIEHVYTFEDDLTISTNTDGTFSFGVLITDTDGYIKGLRIDSLCLTPNTDDGHFPGQTDGGGFNPPFIERCGVVSTPIDNNVSSWTYYHWKNLERFFDCTLMVKLNQMFSLMNDAWKTTRLFMRWCVVLVNKTGDWFTTFVWWLGGHFRNIAVGQVTTVYQSGGGQCSDLFCVLQTLINGILTPLNAIVEALINILGGVTGILFTAINGLLVIIISLISQVLGLLNLGQQLLSALINAYNNATPVAIAGLPNCSLDPRSSAFCMGIWVLDNTIFSGPGAAIIPMLTGILSIHLLIWVVAELKRSVINMGQTA